MVAICLRSRPRRPSALPDLAHVAARRVLRGSLRAAKRGRSVSVCLPARDEAATIGPIVARLPRARAAGRRGARGRRRLHRRHRAVARGGRRPGRRAPADVLPECGPGQGKGEAMWKSLHAAHGDLIVWCDADVQQLRRPRSSPGCSVRCSPTDDVAFVKAFYARPARRRPGEGGRVTELVARPLISILFPHLASVAQPLGRRVRGRREVLEQLPFVQGYGVDLALLVDVADTLRPRRDGPGRPRRARAPQPAARRAGAAGARDHRRPRSHGPGSTGMHVDVEVDERPPMVEVPAYRKSA